MTDQLTLVNVVGGGDIGCNLDLGYLNKELERATSGLNNGIKIKYNGVSPLLLLFNSGKYHLTGAKSVGECFRYRNKFLTDLNTVGISAESTFEIRNLVYVGEIQNDVNLEDIHVLLGLERSEYEPEQFPGIIYKPVENPATFIIFDSGKVVLTGVNSKKQATESFNNLANLLE
jgi:transcription initiation factor TFIID TATA-box-binding protein